jgi:hypothetical protein
MPSWEQVDRFIATTGLAAFLVLAAMFGIAFAVRAAWFFFKPLIADWFAKQLRWFEKQIELVETLIKRLHNSDDYEDSKRKAFVSLGKAVLASADEDKRRDVKNHIDDMRQHLNEDLYDE